MAERRESLGTEMPVSEARENWAEVINRVHYGREVIVLTFHGQPRAVLINPDELSELRRQAGAT